MSIKKTVTSIETFRHDIEQRVDNLAKLEPYELPNTSALGPSLTQADLLMGVVTDQFVSAATHLQAVSKRPQAPVPAEEKSGKKPSEVIDVTDYQKEPDDRA